MLDTILRAVSELSTRARNYGCHHVNVGETLALALGDDEHRHEDSEEECSSKYPIITSTILKYICGLNHSI